MTRQNDTGTDVSPILAGDDIENWFRQRGCKLFPNHGSPDALAPVYDRVQVPDERAKETPYCKYALLNRRTKKTQSGFFSGRE